MTIPGIPYQNPLGYQGLPQNAVPIKLFGRLPAITDVKYPIGTVAIIGNNPMSGTTGDLYYLSKFMSGEAVWLQLLTGAASPGIDSVKTDSGLPEVIADGNGSINIVGGAGCTVTGNGPGNTITVAVTGQGFSWSVISGSTQTIVANHGYFSNNNTGVTFTLPATASVGDTFTVTSINTGGWVFAQNAGQSIRIGNHISTTGVTGSISSTAIGDSITLVCYIANTGFITYSPPQGDITIV